MRKVRLRLLCCCDGRRLWQFRITWHDRWYWVTSSNHELEFVVKAARRNYRIELSGPCLQYFTAICTAPPLARFCHKTQKIATSTICDNFTNMAPINLALEALQSLGSEKKINITLITKTFNIERLILSRQFYQVS